MTIIREQILSNIKTRLGRIRTAYGYQTNAGASVYRVKPHLDPDICPFICVWDQEDQNTDRYGKHNLIMPVTVEAMDAFGSNNPSTIANKMLGDLSECLLGPTFDLDFISGGTYEVAVGNTITGAVSGATACIEAITLSSGTWAGGDADGTFLIRRKIGTFTATEAINVGANLNVATLDSAVTYNDPLDNTTGGLSIGMYLQTAGPSSYPDAGDLIVGTRVVINVQYHVILGNFYNQGS